MIRLHIGGMVGTMVDPTTEQARHALYSVLEDVIGHDNADTLMTHLPQQASGELATRTDILAVKVGLDARFDRLEDRFDRFEDRFDRLEERFGGFHQMVIEQQRFYVGVTVGSMTALTAIFSLVVAFLG